MKDNFQLGKEIDLLDEKIKNLGSNGLGWFKVTDNEISGPLAKILSPNEKQELITFGDGLIVFQAGNLYEVGKYMDILRQEIFKDSVVFKRIKTNKA